ncbi:ribosome small subunit-dependent GTPase A [Ureaplasma parvum]|uniref:ribosome small subunit-dependent GTPase A n=1 Tax=Ureaplasma parvum TaxID=134821 RepID=UPI0026F184E8|nr:ribosome small subunit-dependent GTPase A [Ureaplasma parvum]
MRAKIISVIANNFYVHLYDLKIQTKAIPKGIFKHNRHELKPMVGDDVEVELIGNTYLITKIYERYNQLIRPKVANIDIVLIVVSIVQPDLNTLSLNKYLAFYEARNIKNVLIGLSKYDLANNHLKQKINKLILDYKKNNYTVFILTKENDISLLKEKIKNKTLCLAGNSGVGKSTLINKLDPSIQQRTQEISHFLNRGKHTTTSTKLISFANGFLVDTPGFGNLEVNLTKNEMANAFNDFANYSRFCKFSNCLHIKEPECAVKKAVDEKLIVNWRYDDYLKIIKELPNDVLKIKTRSENKKCK